MNTIRVLAIDPHTVVRAGLRALIDAQTGMEVVGEAADGSTAVQLAAELDPTVMVVELTLPGMTGTQLIGRLCAERPDRKVLVLTACEEKDALRRALAAGAVGYVLKRSGADELVRAIRAAASGEIYLDSTATASAVEDLAPSPEMNGGGLSERESEVVRLIALGYSNKEIAARLRLSVKTVETYKTRSLEKLGSHSRVNLVRYAARRGWLTDFVDEVPGESPHANGEQVMTGG